MHLTRLFYNASAPRALTFSVSFSPLLSTLPFTNPRPYNTHPHAYTLSCTLCICDHYLTTNDNESEIAADSGTSTTFIKHELREQCLLKSHNPQHVSLARAKDRVLEGRQPE